MLVNLKNIPKEILNKIPISIRINSKNNELDIEYLPLDLKYLLKDFISSNDKKQSESQNLKTVKDIRPKISVYSDFETIENTNEIVVEYLKNYLMTRTGDFPFDPKYGCSFLDHLNMTDNQTKKTFIATEISNAVAIISDMFEKDIKIKDSQIGMTGTNDGIGIKYFFKFLVVIDDYSQELLIS